MSDETTPFQHRHNFSRPRVEVLRWAAGGLVGVEVVPLEENQETKMTPVLLNTATMEAYSLLISRMAEISQNSAADPLSKDKPGAD